MKCPAEVYQPSTITYKGLTDIDLSLSTRSLLSPEPDVIVNFFDADRLAGKDRAEVNLFAPQTDASAMDR
jgi:hypothetical protein